MQSGGSGVGFRRSTRCFRIEEEEGDEALLDSTAGEVRRVRGGGRDGGKRRGDDALELGHAGHIWLAGAHVGAGVRTARLESPVARRVLAPDGPTHALA